VHGHVSPGFEAVREAFIENFTRRRELGGACCAFYHGEKVVDVWGGVRNKLTGELWEPDTMVLVYSATKGLAAMTLALAHSRGWLDYEAPVAAYWPEFTQQGKETITVRQLLAHQAGSLRSPSRSTVISSPTSIGWRACSPDRSRPGRREHDRRITPSLWDSTKASWCAVSIHGIAVWDSCSRTRSHHRLAWTPTSACPTRSRTPASPHCRGQGPSRCCAIFRSA
jgi:CubicO group peptidase (beta-lactamase class C family)